MSKQHKLAKFLTDLGYAIVPSGKDGQHFSTLPAWQGLATTDITVVDRWLTAGYSYIPDGLTKPKTIPITPGQLWICAAKYDGVGCLDIDDLQSCLSKGMPPFPEGIRKISTPSGGLHIPFRHTEETRKRGGGCVRLSNVTGTPEFKIKIFEYKADAAAWCAENQTRVGDAAHPAGEYKVIDASDIMIGVPDELQEWLGEWLKNARKQAPAEWSFVDGWDESEFLEHHHCEPLGDSYMDDGSLYMPVVTCPVCDMNCRAAKRGAQCKFIFSGKGFGYTCKFCGLEGEGSTARFKQQMAEKHDDFEPWAEAIYEEIEAEGFDVEDVEDEDHVMNHDDVLRLVAEMKAKQAQAAQAQQAPTAAVPAVGTIELATLDVEDDALVVGTKGGEFAWSVNVTKASDVKLERIEWLWPGRVPASKITLFTGKGDCGKSLVLLDAVSRVTRGTDWPDGTKNVFGPRRVVMAMSEDDLGDTVVPRLTAAGADLDMIEFLKDISIVEKGGSRKRRGLRLKDDMSRLKKALKANPDVALLAFDAISSYFGSGDSNKDKDMRPIFEDMARTCSETKTAIIGIIHHNKNSELDAVQKILGAGSIGHVTRAIWAFSRNPENKLEYFMAKAKGNLAKVGRGGMTYTVEDFTLKIDGVDTIQPQVNWLGENDMDANAVAAHAREVAKNGDGAIGADTQLGKARLLITSSIAPGHQKLTKEMYALAEKEGISIGTMKNAAKSLGIRYIGKNPGPWHWQMPNVAVEKVIAAASKPLDDVREM